MIGFSLWRILLAEAGKIVSVCMSQNRGNSKHPTTLKKRKILRFLGEASNALLNSISD
jgi:hypothetical protein